MKRCLAIHDISCVGKCSITIALPVISSAGVECNILPTSLLSTHTGGFTGFTFLDLSDEMNKIVNHFKTLTCVFDSAYSGYLGNISQINFLIELVHYLKERNPNFKMFCDPVMADCGELYPSFDMDFVNNMKELIKVSDVVMPNVTEACLLTGEKYNSKPDKIYAKKLAKKLAKLGPNIVILTGIYKFNKIGAVAYDKVNNKFYDAYSDIVPGYYHGTGDLFASAVVGSLMNKLSLKSSIKLAIDLVYKSIYQTNKDELDRKYGVEFEYFLGDYAKSIKKELKKHGK